MKLKLPKNRYILITVLALVAGILIALLGIPLTQAPKVQSTLPNDGDVGVSESFQITVTFAKNLTKKEQSEISLSLNPDVRGNILWLSPDKLQYALLSNLDNGKKYTVVVQFKTLNIHSFSFTTRALAAPPQEDQIHEQSQDDNYFSLKARELLTTYPWYSKMPIVTTDYVIVYDFEKNAFRIRIIAPLNISPTALKQIQNNAIQSLRNIGVDLSTIKYFFAQDSGS